MIIIQYYIYVLLYTLMSMTLIDTSACDHKRDFTRTITIEVNAPLIWIYAAVILGVQIAGYYTLLSRLLSRETIPDARNHLYYQEAWKMK